MKHFQRVRFPLNATHQKVSYQQSNAYKYIYIKWKPAKPTNNAWSYDVMVSIPDFESGYLGSNPGKTYGVQELATLN